jgi:hypothetical protein
VFVWQEGIGQYGAVCQPWMVLLLLLLVRGDARRLVCAGGAWLWLASSVSHSAVVC